ncbi:MAG TPA: Gmad2 immunoglobulin-like domain-containing protein [Acidimicrobiales bacterium]|nr:Gmad2 immunoglobulin-like domain-containing protein [Acidimicrobiales bacterium]
MSRTTLTDAQKWTLGGVSALVVVLLVAALVVAGGDDGDEDAGTTTTTSSTTTTEATTSSGPSSTSTTAFGPAVDPYAVAFPSPEASRSFESPESAAQAYATDVLGFTELELGDTDQATADAAAVVVRDRADGPETVVELQRFDGGAWYVLGSTTADVAVRQPTPGASLSTPFATSGEALAFEGSVEVVVLRQGDPEPIGSGTVTGSGAPPAGPFSGSISYDPPAEPTPGVLVYRVRSPEDGRVVQATSLRVRLTGLTS